MKRIFLFFSALVAICLVALVVVYFNASRILAWRLSAKLGTNVSITALKLTPPVISIDDAVIFNPSPFTAPTALTFGKLELVAPYSNYLHNVIHIDNLTLSDIVLTVQTIGKETNWGVIMNHFNENTKSNDGSYAIIRTLKINNLKVRVQTGQGQVQEHNLGNLEFHNVKTTEGHLSKIILQTILSQMFLNLKGIITNPLGSAGEAVDSLFDGFKGAVGPKQ